MNFKTDKHKANFHSIVELRKRWLNEFISSDIRKDITRQLVDIEYESLTNEQRISIINYKSQLANYVKTRLVSPQKKIKLKDYISEPSPPQSSVKILFCPLEVANFGHIFSTAMRSIGVEAYMINLEGAHKFAYVADASRLRHANDYIEKYEIIDYVVDVIVEFDVFNFFFSKSLMPDFSDLPVYRELGKKTVAHYFGSDIRMYSIAVRKNPYLTMAKTTFFKNHIEDEKRIFENLQIFSNYVDGCMVGGCEFEDILKLYYANYHEYKQPILIEDTKKEIKKSSETSDITDNRFLIVHAPSNPEIKGTTQIQQAIEELKCTYDFDFVLIKNMSHNEALKTYKRADLVIDHIIYGWFGMVTLESMVMGKPVIIHVAECFKHGLHPDNPLINANPSNIKDKIEWALNNKNELKEIGDHGRQYVEMVHNAKNVSMSLLETYDTITPISPNQSDMLKNKDTIDFEALYFGMLLKQKQGKTLKQYLLDNNYRTIAIYGFGTCGRWLMNELYSSLSSSSPSPSSSSQSPSQIEVKYIIDQRDLSQLNDSGVKYSFIQKETLHMCTGLDLVILTIPYGLIEAEQNIKKHLSVDVYSIEQLLLMV